MGIQRLLLFVASSVIIGGLLFVVFGVRASTNAVALDALRYQTAKRDLLNVVQMIEGDFDNMGASMYWDPGCSCFVGEALDPSDVLRPDAFDSVAVAGGYRYTLRFVAQTDSTAPPAPVRYRWEPRGDSVTLRNGTSRQLYSFWRTVDGVPAGESHTVTEVRVKPQPAERSPLWLHPGDWRRFDLRVRGASPFGTGTLIEETHFEGSYRPVGLTLHDHP